MIRTKTSRYLRNRHMQMILDPTTKSIYRVIGIYDTWWTKIQELLCKYKRKRGNIQFWLHESKYWSLNYASDQCSSIWMHIYLHPYLTYSPPNSFSGSNFAHVTKSLIYHLKSYGPTLRLCNCYLVEKNLIYPELESESNQEAHNELFS